MAVIQDIYKFDGDATGSIKAINAQIDAIDKLEKELSIAEKGTDKYKLSQKQLEAELQKLSKGMQGQTKTLEGLGKKQGILLDIIKKTDKGSKLYKATLKELQKVNQELAEDTAALAGGMDGLQNRYAVMLDRVKGFGIAGVTLAGAKLAFDQLNHIVTETNAKLNQVQNKFQDLDNAAQIEVTAGIDSLAETYELEFDGIIRAVNAADKQISSENATSALEEIRAGLSRASSDFEREELLEQVTEYATFIEQSGMTLGEGIATIELGNQLGVFTDKALDSVKEVNIRLGEGTKATREAVSNAFGKGFTEDLFGRINNGTLSTKDAFIELSEKVKEGGLSIQQYNELVAGIGGGALEDAGRAFFESFSGIDDIVNQTTESLTPYQQRLAEQEQLTQRVKEVQIQLAQSLQPLSQEYANFGLQLKAEAIEALLQFLNAMQDAPEFIRQNKTAIVVLLGSISALIAMQNKQLITEKAKIAITKINIAIEKVRAVATKVSIASIRRHTVATIANMNAQKALGIAMKATPWGLAAAALGVLIASLIKFNQVGSKRVQQLRQVADLTKEVSERYVDEKAQLDALFKPLNDDNASREDKAKAIKAIQDQYGDYLKSQGIDITNTNQLTTAYDALNKKIIENIVADVKMTKTKALLIKQIELEQKKIELEGKLLAAQNEEVNNFDVGLARTTTGRTSRILEAQKDIEAVNSALKENNDEITDIGKVLDEVASRLPKSISADLSAFATATAPPPVTKPSSSSKKVKESADKTSKIIEGSLADLQSKLSELNRIYSQEIDQSNETAVKAQLEKIHALEKRIEEFKKRNAALFKEEYKPVAFDPAKAETLESKTIEPLANDLPPLELDTELKPPNLAFFREEVNKAKAILETLNPFDKEAVKAQLDNIAVAEKRLAKAEAAVNGGLENEFLSIVDTAEQIFNGAADIIGGMFDASEQRLSGAVDRQQAALDKMLSNSENYTAEQIALEKERLEEAQAAQEKAAKRARALQIAQTLANSIIAVTKAAAEGGAFAPATIVATIAAIGAGIGAVSQLANNSFYKGVDKLDLMGNPAGRDTIPAMTSKGNLLRLDEGEGILQSDMNQRRHDAFKALRRHHPLGDVFQEIAVKYPRVQSLSELGDLVQPFTLRGVMGLDGANIRIVSNHRDTNQAIKEQTNVMRQSNHSVKDLLSRNNRHLARISKQLGKKGGIFRDFSGR